MIRTLLFLSLAAATAQSQTLPISGERRLPGARDIVQQLVMPGDVEVVSNGDSFLAIWAGGQYATRIDSSGRTIDRPSLQLTADPLPVDNAHADAAWDGNSYIVASFLREIGLTRVDDAGNATRIASIPTTVGERGLELAASSRAIVVVMPLFPADTDVVFMRPDGTVISKRPLTGTAVDVASDGDRFLVLFPNHAVLFDELGTVVSTTTHRDARPTAATFNGRDYVTAGSLIQRFDRSGDLRSERPLASGAVASDGVTVAVAWKDIPSPVIGLHVATARIDGAGDANPVDAFMNESAGVRGSPADPPAIATNGETYLVVWTEGSTMPLAPPQRGVFSLAFRASETLNTEAVQLRREVVATRYPARRNVVAARAGPNALAVWLQSADAPTAPSNPSRVRWNVAASRLTPSGVPLDGAGFAIGHADYGTDSPAAAWNGHETVVVWSRERGVAGAFVGVDGAFAPFEIASEGWAPKIGCGESVCLVVWQGVDRQLYAARIAGRDVLDLGGIPVASFHALTSVDVASDGRNFLVAWQERVGPSEEHAIIHTIFIADPRQAWTTRAQDLAVIETSFAGAHVTFDGSSYIVVWGREELRASRVSASGHSLDGDQTGWTGHAIANLDASSWGVWDADAQGDVYVVTSSEVLRVRGGSIAPTGRASLPASAGNTSVVALSPTNAIVFSIRNEEVRYQVIGEFRRRAAAR